MKLAGMILIGFTCGLASAQTPNGQPSFEVASIKPAPPPEAGKRIAVGSPPSPGRYACAFCSLRMLIVQAYGIVGYQLTAPDWLDSERFNISAKMPDGTPKEQMQLMLQNLLTERFKLAVHRDQKEMQMYDLVVAKGGPKMKESTEEPGEKPLDASGLTAGGRGSLTMGKDGFPAKEKDGFPAFIGRGSGIIMMNGRTKLKAEMETMEQFAKRLSNQIGKPVTDATGLTAKYDFTLIWDGGGRGFPMPPGGGPDANTPLGVAPDGDSLPTIYSAVQSQLGLKLESKKGQVEIIVVDHMERVPTEN